MDRDASQAAIVAVHLAIIMVLSASFISGERSRSQRLLVSALAALVVARRGDDKSGGNPVQVINRR